MFVCYTTHIRRRVAHRTCFGTRGRSTAVKGRLRPSVPALPQGFPSLCQDGLPTDALKAREGPCALDVRLRGAGPRGKARSPARGQGGASPPAGLGPTCPHTPPHEGLHSSLKTQPVSFKKRAYALKVEFSRTSEKANPSFGLPLSEPSSCPSGLLGERYRPRASGDLRGQTGEAAAPRSVPSAEPGVALAARKITSSKATSTGRC